MQSYCFFRSPMGLRYKTHTTHAVYLPLHLSLHFTQNTPLTPLPCLTVEKQTIPITPTKTKTPKMMRVESNHFVHPTDKHIYARPTHVDSTIDYSSPYASPKLATLSPKRGGKKFTVIPVDASNEDTVVRTVLIDMEIAFQYVYPCDAMGNVKGERLDANNTPIGKCDRLLVVTAHQDRFLIVNRV
eukprot:TRINITY_DN6376_c0_g1_i2.p1 TRINITY_DN6376_c0_g1~~TRINITY_DN6376_c0_g1_i2.p1  ORF type:complete len:186 (-),score=27.68 TRINITY_DN6376_c0_g1_i2:197-754(-)